MAVREDFAAISRI